ncbi:MAG: hypothetical protein JW947_08775 [Sedimentisphaerales bacterium]|nr:hypothetical protein [Sedimentisphaerales bacterium]
MKNKKDLWLLIGGIVIGAIIGFYFFVFARFLLFFTPRKPSPPKIAGVKVPSKTYEIDFSKRYNLTLDSQHSSVTFTNCLIKGFTQGKPQSSPSRYDYFDTWLVVELSDGRVIYLPPRNVVMIEESKQTAITGGDN